MKNIIIPIICLFLLTTFTSTAQDYLAIENHTEVKSYKPTKSEMIKMQEEAFHLSVENEISKHLVYPEDFIDNRIMGNVLAQVLFDPAYKNYSIHIIKGDKAYLGKLVENAIQKIDIASYIPLGFEGKKSYVFNIAFSLDE